MTVLGPAWGPPPDRLRDRLALGVRRAGRWLRDRGVGLRPRAQLVYHPGYLDFSHEAGGRHSFDVRRPARILEQLSRLRVLSHRQVLTPAIASHSELSTVHPPDYLERIADPLRLARLLNVPQTDGAALPQLAPFAWQTGGTLLAAEQALTTGITTVNLGGGFHHAQRDRTEGFCPLNDIAVAINVLRERRGLERVLVIDLDYHQGDGTALIFSGDEDVFTLSVHGQTWVELRDKQHNLDIQLPGSVSDQAYLRVVQDALTQTLSRFQPQLALYVAGADPASRDRFGDFGIGETALARRDSFVATRLRQARVPLAIVLGGGYGPLAWSIPFNFIFALLTGMELPEPLRPSNITARYQRVHRSLRPEELGREDSALDDDDIWAQLDSRGPIGGRFLGYYTREGVELALERYGFLDLLREIGFDDFLITVDTRSSSRHTIRLHFGQRDPEHLLIELAGCLRPLLLADGQSCRMLRIEWLLMQNPRESFNLQQPPLPGQDYPGLGLFRWFGELLRLMATRLECDGLTNQPQHFHNGHLYGKVMKFYRPEDEGMLRALERDLGEHPLAEVTAAMGAGRVIDVDSGEPQRWEVGAQVLPITLRLATFFESDAYREAMRRERDRRHFRLGEMSI